MTPKEMARKAVEDWLNKAWDLPFGYGEHGNEEYHKAPSSTQKKADVQAVKLINRALKAIGSSDQYEQRA